MVRLGITFINIDDTVVQPRSELVASITRISGHRFIQCNPQIFFVNESRAMSTPPHWLGHPFTDKSMKIPKRSGTADVGADIIRVLHSIERSCESCQKYVQKLRQFKSTLRDVKDFNHIVCAEIY